jgi:hypothetical protein
MLGFVSLRRQFVVDRVEDVPYVGKRGRVLAAGVQHTQHRFTSFLV